MPATRRVKSSPRAGKIRPSPAPAEEDPWRPGAASLWWLHGSLAALRDALAKLGAPLVLRGDDSLAERRRLDAETGAKAIFWNRLYEPASIARDTRVKAALKADGIDAKSFNAALLHEPWTIEKQTGGPFQVFTPFWRHCCKLPVPEPLAAPERLAAFAPTPQSLALDELRLLPAIPWDAGMRDAWTPGEAGARAALVRFLDAPIADYPDARDVPSTVGTSRLSPHLHFGEIGPRRIFREVANRAERTASDRGVAKYLAEVGWREFSHHLLYHFPQTTDAPLRADFAEFPWNDDAAHLRAWRRGRTGYPIVDAGMRELWTTGWMHNRVRMVVASFLVKHLRLHWLEGARWFWDTLVDADLAQNTLGWQWAAGCGADAAPYFRIFNPMLQGAKFDPDGAYVKRWVPELAKLPAKWIHAPWEAPRAALLQAGVRPGDTYPEPVVDHATAREEALAAFASIRKT